MTTYKTCRKCGRRYSGRCSHGKPHAARSVGASRRRSAADVLGRDPFEEVPPDMPVFSRERFEAMLSARSQRADLVPVEESQRQMAAGMVEARRLIERREIPAEDIEAMNHDEYLTHIADQHADMIEFYEVSGVE